MSTRYLLFGVYVLAMTCLSSHSTAEASSPVKKGAVPRRFETSVSLHVVVRIISCTVTADAMLLCSAGKSALFVAALLTYGMLLVGRFLLGCSLIDASSCVSDLGNTGTTTYKNVANSGNSLTPQTVAPINQRTPSGKSHAMQKMRCFCVSGTAMMASVHS